jgi:hypothetical protein
MPILFILDQLATQQPTLRELTCKLSVDAICQARQWHTELTNIEWLVV